MAVLTRYRNPIEWQETQHQQRNIPDLLRRYGWLALPLLLVVVAGVVLTLRDLRAPTRELALYVIWIVHAITAARAIAVGANAISREHVGLTWDTLILTGVSTRQILWGKWLGVLRPAAPWMLLLGTVRLAMLPVFMLAFVNRYAWRFNYARSSYYYSYGGFDYYPPLEWVPWALLVAVAMTVILTALEVMACTALGLAASAILRRGWLAMIAAFAIRSAPVILFAAFTRYEVGNAPSWRLLRFPALALADGGSAPLYQMSLPLSAWTQAAHLNALPGLLMATVLLLSILSGSLLVTWLAIRRSGALPHPKPAIV